MSANYNQKAFEAVRNGNLHMLNVLIIGGFFDVKTTDENGRTIFDIAKEKFSNESYSLFERQISGSVSMRSKNINSFS